MFALSCNQDVRTEKELYLDAQKFEAAQEFNKALKIYDLIIENYPESQDRYKAVFMIGFLQMEHLKNKKESIEAFDRLISEYPDCDLADDAAVLRDIALKGADIMSTFEDSLDSK